MAKHHKTHEKPKSSDEHPDVETIATCGCAHEFFEHSEMGCMKGECECDLERSMLLVGKLKAIDEL